MPLLDSERASLVYTQDENVLTIVGEPIEVTSLSRIVIAKTGGLYAEALRTAWLQAFPQTRPEICYSGAALLQALRERAADFALMGLTFADIDGIDVLETNAREQLARRVFIVSSRKDEHTLRALRVARFDGFFDPLEEGAAALAGALQQVVNGRGYISPALCRRLVERRAMSPLTQRLTHTELVVFSLLGDGTDDDAAASQLGLSKATIQSHRRNLMRKLDVPTSARLVAEAVRLGVVRLLPDGGVVRPGFERMLADWQMRRTRG